MHVFITGVSSGIGWGLSKHYLSEGHQVYGLSRRVPEDLIQNKNFHHIICDLTNFESIPGLLTSLLSKVSKIDLAILNAGILGPIANMKDQSLDNLTKVMNINVWANKPIIDALLETVPNTKKVVAISSGAAINGNKGWGGYSISKAALNMFIKLYASENKNTAFYSFAPGLIDTPMQDYLCGDELDVSKFPSAQKLKDARYTPNMPTAENAGEILAKGIDELDKLQTGSFADIRKM
jgi:benzil reductase ((S)-benzoin forming)